MRNEMKKAAKKGVSPVIATILLIAMVVVIALIIFLWFRGLNREAITKFDGTNVEVICGDVQIEASYSSGAMYVLNRGNVPVYTMKMKNYAAGSYDTLDMQEIDSGWPSNGLNPGNAYSSSALSSYVDSSEKTILVPVLIGLSESGDQKLFVCQDQYAHELAIE